MNVNPKFDGDTEALAWAREKAASLVQRFRDFEVRETRSGGFEEAKRWRVAANITESHLIGGTGCVIAAFDARMPALVAALVEVESRRGDDQPR